MKKSITILLAVFALLGAFLTSCTNEVAVQGEELVSVSFEEEVSRALSATLGDFTKGAYYWKYSAQKSLKGSNMLDGSGLKSGQTENYETDIIGAKWVSVDSTKAPQAGLADYKVAGFSQGIWDFKLFAYSDKEGEKLVYTGEAKEVTLQKGGTNKVSVVVSPAPSGNGTLVLDVSEISLAPKNLSGTDTASVSNSFTVVGVDNGTTYSPSSVDSQTKDVIYTLPVGAYKVTVTYKTNSITFAEGFVVATVYPNLTTTVKGSVDELVTYAQFDAEQNPDIISRTASATGITSSTNKAVSLSEPTVDGQEKKVSASIPAAALTGLVPDGATMDLALNVDTKDSSSTSVTFEIGLTKTITQDSESVTSAVESLNGYAEVTVKIRTGLTNVKVEHNGVGMIEGTKADDDEDNKGVYKYDSTTGALTIWTKSFSPFAVEYELIDYVAKIGDVKYASLEDAIANAKTLNGNLSTKETITLLHDVNLSKRVTIDKGLVLDLGGYTLSGGTSDDQHVIDVKAYNHEDVIIKNGTVDAGEYQAINIYGKDSRTSGGCNLIVEEDAIISGGYGVILREAPNTKVCFGVAVRIKGTIKADAGLWVMGNIYESNSENIIYRTAVIEATDVGVALNGNVQLIVQQMYDNSQARITGFNSAIEVRAGKLEVLDGVFKATSTNFAVKANGSGTTTSGAAIAIAQHTTRLPIRVTINGGSFTGLKALSMSDPEVGDPKDVYVGCYGDSSFNGKKHEALILNGDCYTDLQEAITDANAGDTVVLLKNIDLTSKNISIPTGKEIILDINNKEVKCDNNYDIRVFGSLTLRDLVKEGFNNYKGIYSSTDYSTGHSSGLIYVSGTLNYESGVINAVRENAQAKGQYGIQYDKDAHITISGGSITAGWYALTGNGNNTGNPKISITGGTLVSTSDYAIYQPDNASITITDGVVSGAAGAICSNKGSLDISGGQFASSGDGNTGSWSDGTGGLSDNTIILNAKYGNVSANISGGVFTAQNDAVVLNTGSTYTANFSITGGKFSSSPNSSYIANGFAVSELDADGYYTVSAT